MNDHDPPPPADSPVPRDNADHSNTPASRRPNARTAVIITALLLTILATAVLIVLTRATTGPIHALDYNTADDLHRYITSHRSQIPLWKTVTNAGGPTVWRVLAAIAAIVLWIRRHRRDAVLIALAMTGAALLSGVTKTLVGRTRPVLSAPVDRADGNSFPSGHALTSFVAIGLLLVLVLPLLATAQRAAVSVLAAAIAAAVGFSRLILGVHFVTDVIGGWLIGAAWLTAVLAVLRRQTADKTPATSRP